MSRTFAGGLHIEDHKTITNHIPIRSVPGAPIHIYPLQQHIGAPAEALVKPGDRVLKGQKIADSGAFVSAPVHASISGTVTEIKPHLHPSGATVTSIFVENDFLEETAPTVCPKDPSRMSREEMLAVIREAGIVGMGGAGFPTHVKLSPSSEKKITHVIVNGAECEPYLTSDHRRMLEMPEEVIGGLRLAMQILGLSEGWIGVEENKPDAIRTLEENAGEGIHVVPLRTKYPQGAEKQLIYAITRRKVPSGGLPADAGAIVLNVDTASAIYRAFIVGMPVVERIITMTGDCWKEPGNLAVPLGVPFSYLRDAVGGFLKEPKRLIMGGPMMGTAQYSLDVPVIKTTSCLLALSEAETVYDATSPCIRCGKCVAHCPMHLMPLYLSKYAAAGDLEKAEKYHIMDCMECGVCSYLCPGSQSPLQNIRIAKQQILENRRKKS